MENTMTLSWRIQRNASIIGINYSRSESLTMAHKAHKVLVALKGGKASFSYIKRDGSVRQAVGTTNHNLIPASARSLFSPRTKSACELLMQNYFDFGINEWRRFYITDLV